MDIDSVVRYSLSNAEIDNLQTAFDEYEVRRLQVGMYDILLVHGHDCLKHLLMGTSE